MHQIAMNCNGRHIDFNKYNLYNYIQIRANFPKGKDAKL